MPINVRQACSCAGQHHQTCLGIDGKLFACTSESTEFPLLQQGGADFAIGSTINWSPQVKELNLFSLPFMFPNHTALDAVELGEPGKRIFQLIEQQGVVPSPGARTASGR